MNKKIKTEAVDHLFDAILTLKDPEECYKFFEDVCTINELLSLSQRYEVAKMLREGKTYLEIAEKTGASTATISRVNRSLNYGAGGYEDVFRNLAEQQAQKVRRDDREQHIQQYAEPVVADELHHAPRPPLRQEKRDDDGAGQKRLHSHGQRPVARCAEKREPGLHPAHHAAQ